MKKTLHLMHKGALPFLTLALILTCGACSRKVAFSPSSTVPAADGWARVKKTENHYAVKIRIANLAPAERLNPPQRVYIVWVDTESDGVRWLGSMNSSKKFMSKALSASLDATIPYKPVMVMITAEDETRPSSPGTFKIMRTTRIN